MHGGTLRSQFGETSEALFLTQGYVYDSSLQAERRFKNEEPGYQYSRFSNPTVTMFEQRMALLEGAEAARATATGMAAVNTALMGQVRAGDHVVASKPLFGSCRYIVEDHLPRYGVTSTLVDGTDLDQWKQGGAEEHQDVLPGKPDQSQRSRCSTSPRSPRSRTRPARRWWSTTCSRRRCSSSPLELGADCVVYSATKHIDGQGRCLGGVILGSREIHHRTMCITLIRQTGPSLSPFNAWVLLKGLETLAVRVQQADRQRRRGRGRARRASQGDAADLSRAGPTIRRPRSSAGR